MSRFFLWAMRSAAAILFALSLLIAGGAIAYHAFVYLETSRAVVSGAMSMSPPLSITQLIFSVMTGLGSAALPLFGAALIWRLDRWLAGGNREPGE